MQRNGSARPIQSADRNAGETRLLGDRWRILRGGMQQEQRQVRPSVFIRGAHAERAPKCRTGSAVNRPRSARSTGRRRLRCRRASQAGSGHHEAGRLVQFLDGLHAEVTERRSL